jgi:hypothetical protein
MSERGSSKHRVCFAIGEDFAGDLSNEEIKAWAHILVLELSKIMGELEYTNYQTFHLILP